MPTRLGPAPVRTGWWLTYLQSRGPCRHLPALGSLVFLLTSGSGRKGLGGVGPAWGEDVCVGHRQMGICNNA